MCCLQEGLGDSKMKTETVSRYQKYKESYIAYHKANREHILERQRQWRKKHPKYFSEYRKKNPEYPIEYARTHRDARNESGRRWRKNNLEKKRVGNLITNHPKRYPLDDECAFCGATEKLEHGHMDYEDEGYNYITVCRRCNYWMDIGDSKP